MPWRERKWHRRTLIIPRGVVRIFQFRVALYTESPKADCLNQSIIIKTYDTLLCNWRYRRCYRSRDTRWLYKEPAEIRSANHEQSKSSQKLCPFLYRRTRPCINRDNKVNYAFMHSISTFTKAYKSYDEGYRQLYALQKWRFKIVITIICMVQYAKLRPESKILWTMQCEAYTWLPLVPLWVYSSGRIKNK